MRTKGPHRFAGCRGWMDSLAALVSNDFNLVPMMTLLAGGLARFLFGLELMTGGLKAVAGSRLQLTRCRIWRIRCWEFFWEQFLRLLFKALRATLAIVIASASQGLMPLEAGIALILGANVGTCGTALLASIGKSAESA